MITILNIMQLQAFYFRNDWTSNPKVGYQKEFFNLDECMCEELEALEKDKGLTREEFRKKYFDAMEKKFGFRKTDTILRDKNSQHQALVDRNRIQELNEIENKIETARKHCKEKNK
jgi:hypothetical protein